MADHPLEATMNATFLIKWLTITALAAVPILLMLASGMTMPVYA